MGAAAKTVLVLQKGRFFLGTMRTGKIPINTSFSTLNIASTAQRGVNLIIRDKHSHLRHFCHVGSVFTSRQVEVLQCAQNLSRLVVVEA